MSHSDESGRDHVERFEGPPIGVDTVVRCERGRWLVDIVVAFRDGVVRRQVGDYSSEREARIAASWVRRGADRDIDGPVNG